MAVDFYNAGMNSFQAGHHKEAYDWLIQDDKDPRCAYALGTLFYNGQGVERDFAKSTHYYSIAADSGIVPAQISAGFAYANAMGVPEDFEKAAHYLKMAAKHNEPAAMITLAEIYANGQAGGSRKEAAELIRDVERIHGGSEEASDVSNRYELYKIRLDS